MNITSITKPAFIIGNPVAHSRSPVFQNAAFQNMNIDSVYLALNIQKDKFDTAIKGLKTMDLLGINITIPYKIDIMKYLDEKTCDAEKIGSVNTIEIKNCKWIGHNTDWYGFYKTLEINKINKSSKILVIGAGGATNGVIYGLKKYGITSIDITNRTIEKAQIIKDIFDIKLIDFTEYKKYITGYDVIINCTSFDFKELTGTFDKNKTYIDLKYYVEKPDITNYIDGKLMLLYQGAKSFEIWTGKNAPIEVMKAALGI